MGIISSHSTIFANFKQVFHYSVNDLKLRLSQSNYLNNCKITKISTVTKRNINYNESVFLRLLCRSRLFHFVISLLAKYALVNVQTLKLLNYD